MLYRSPPRQQMRGPCAPHEWRERDWFD